MCHFAEHEDWVSPAAIKKLARHLDLAGAPATLHTYPGTTHWFFESDRADSFEPKAAALAWKRTVAFLAADHAAQRPRAARTPPNKRMQLAALRAAADAPSAGRPTPTTLSPTRLRIQASPATNAGADAEVPMAKVPASVERFLQGRRFAVAGVSRDPAQPANAIFRRLRDIGREVVPVNPSAGELEGVRCYPDLAAIEGAIDGVVIATHPRVALDVVRQCADRGVPSVWFHRSFGDGSVSEEAVREGRSRGIDCIVGGCPLMYCGRVDIAHRCMRAWLRLGGRVPG